MFVELDEKVPVVYLKKITISKLRIVYLHSQPHGVPVEGNQGVHSLCSWIFTLASVAFCSSITPLMNVLEQPQHVEILSYWQYSPIASTRAGPVLEMVEPVHITDYYLPFGHKRDEGGCIVAVCTHPEVLPDVNAGTGLCIQ